MFADHWLVADMDGTLTPTPTRAHGKYLSLSTCAATGLGYGERYRSCLPWLRYFIERGGSLCVVTTAGKRMWSQLYVDLAPALFRLGASATPLAEKVTAAPSVAAAAPPPPSPGRLYMCGFTGAALFRTRPWEAVWADMDRQSPGWRTASRITVPPTALAVEEWAAYRQQGVAARSAVSGGASATVAAAATVPADGSPRTASVSTTLDAAAHRLAVEEGRSAIVRFFEHASYVSGHDPDVAASFFAGCLSTKYHAVYTSLLRQLLEEASPQLAAWRRNTSSGIKDAEAPPVDSDGAVPHVCFAESAVLSPEALATYGFFLTETHDALVDAQQLPCADGTVAEGAPVAQVVVMGIPMRHFNSIFPAQDADASAPAWQCCGSCGAAGRGAKARLEALGLELKAQPNSVCVHRRGVDKGLCVNWFISQGAEPASSLAFDLTKAVAFGDVPESVDRPLTEFPPMQFISLSPLAAAKEALAQLRPASAPGAPTHLHLVGGEEEGSAVFLQELLTCVAQEDGAGAGAGAASWFTPARVAACAARAQAVMQAELADRRRAKADPQSSHSTL